MSGDKKTAVTFNEPVEIPGYVLIPGQYVMELADLQADRDVVEIFNKDENKLIATVIGIPAYREQTPDETIVNLEERAGNSPEAVKSRFYPGDHYGVQFVCPHVRVERTTTAALAQTCRPLLLRCQSIQRQ
jgi:hypothetical protein